MDGSCHLYGWFVYCVGGLEGLALQHTATHCSTLQRTVTHCNTLQHTATHYNTHACRHTSRPRHKYSPHVKVQAVWHSTDDDGLIVGVGVGVWVWVWVWVWVCMGEWWVCVGPSSCVHVDFKASTWILLQTITDVDTLQILQQDRDLYNLFVCRWTWRPQHKYSPTWKHTVTHYNTMQHTTTHCNTLQHTATHCNAHVYRWTLRPRHKYSRTWKYSGPYGSLPLRCKLSDPVCCSVLQCVAGCCRVLQCVAVCCNLLLCVAVCCSML